MAGNDSSTVFFDTARIEQAKIGPIDTEWLILESSSQPGLRLRLQAGKALYRTQYDLNTNNDEAYLNDDSGVSDWTDRGILNLSYVNGLLSGKGYVSARGNDQNLYVEFNDLSLKSDIPSLKAAEKPANLGVLSVPAAQLFPLFEVANQRLPTIYQIVPPRLTERLGYASDENLFVLTFGKYIAVSDNGGKSWQHTAYPNRLLSNNKPLFHPNLRSFSSVHIVGDHILVTNSNGSAYSSNRGKTWLFHSGEERKAFGFSPLVFNGIDLSESEPVGLYKNQIIFAGKQNGALWDPDSHEFTRSFESPFSKSHLPSTGDNLCFVSSDNSALAFYNLDQDRWKFFYKGSHGLEGDVRIGVQDGNTLIIGGNSGLYQSKDRGESFHKISEIADFPAYYEPWKIAALNGDEIVLELMRKRPNLNYIWRADFKDIITPAIRQGYFSISRDGGTTWEHDFYDQVKDNGQPHSLKLSDNNFPLQLAAYSSVEYVMRDSKDNMYRHSDPAAPHAYERSIDLGKTWEPYDANFFYTNVYSINSKHVDISRDNGMTWDTAPFRFSNPDISRTGIGKDAVPVFEEIVLAAQYTNGDFHSHDREQVFTALNNLYNYLGFRFVPDNKRHNYSNRVIIKNNEIVARLFLGTDSYRYIYSSDYGKTYVELNGFEKLSSDLRSYFIFRNVNNDRPNVSNSVGYKPENEVYRFSISSEYLFVLLVKPMSQNSDQSVYEIYRQPIGDETADWDFVSTTEARFSHPEFAVNGKNMLAHYSSPFSAGFLLTNDGGVTWKHIYFSEIINMDSRVLEYIRAKDYELFPINSGVLLYTPLGIYEIRLKK